jgi:cytochrome d ubiquinol oxidase subunit II
MILQTIWFLLIVVLLTGYSILDGFDLGVGTLVPFLAKNDNEKRILFNAVGPVWDGNEVWLLTGGGALFAAFPPVYATVFSGFYLALMLVLFSLIFRAVSFEYWAHDDSRRGLWCKAIVVGSFLPSLLYGVALGNIIVGIPLNQNYDFAGTFFTLLRPFPLITGLLGLTAILFHGAAFTALKAEGQIRERAHKILLTASYVFIGLFALTVIVGIFRIQGIAANIVGWIFVLLIMVFWFLMNQNAKKGKDGKAFTFSALIHASLWGLIAAIQFPVVVRATDSTLNMTIYNSSSSQLTLTVMLIIALIGMPFVIGYTIYAYRIFKGKINLHEGENY